MNRSRIALWTICALVVVFLVAPIGVIVITSFNDSAYLDFPPKRLSLRWYANFFSSAHWYDSALLSLRVAVMTMVAATVLGTTAAIGIARSEFPAKRLVEAFLVSPMVVPLVVIALGFYFLFSPYALLNTTVGLFLSHTVIATPIVVVMVRAALRTTSPDMELAARSLGATFSKSLLHVTLPSIKATIVAAAAFAFLISFDDVVLAVFVAGPDTTTLPKRMWESIRFEIDPSLTAIASMLTLLAIVVLLIVEALKPPEADSKS